MPDPCKRCSGSGFEPDPKTIGESMRKAREDAGLSLRQVATRMGYSAAYVSDLERGQRLFGHVQKRKFTEAIEGLKKKSRSLNF